MKIYCWLQVICCLHCFINNILDIRRQYNLTDLAFLGIISSQIVQSYQQSRFILEKDIVLKRELGSKSGLKEKERTFQSLLPLFSTSWSKRWLKLGIFQQPFVTLIRGKESFGFSCLLINQRLWETNHISVKTSTFTQRIYSFSQH